MIVSPAEMHGAMGRQDPDLTVIVDEASSLDDPIFEALMGNVVSERNRIVLPGNPLRKAGPFSKTHRVAGNGWWLRVVSAFEVLADPSYALIPGLVSKAGVGALRQTFGEESQAFAARVHARFPTTDADALHPEALLVAAVARWHEGALRRKYLNSRLKAGLDLAASEDGDASALAIAFGGRHVEAIHIKRHRDTMVIAGWCVATLRIYNVRRGNRALAYAAEARGFGTLGDPTVALRNVTIYGDEIAWGKGALDRLKEAGFPAQGVNVARRPADEEKAKIYANERARIAYAFRELLVTGTVAIPPDEELLEELRVYKAFSNSAGKQQCCPKAELRAALGRSPDKMDAVLLATCAEVEPAFDTPSAPVAF